MRIIEQSVTLEFITPNAVQLIEKFGRVCYRSEDKINQASAVKFVKMLKERGHESVLEHASATFRVICDRGVTHEIVRHRIASYSQESTRYCNYCQGKHGGELTIIQTPNLKGEESLRVWLDANAFAEQSYRKLIELGNAPEIARSILPTDLKTEIVITYNFREWLHFLKLRASPKAHPQMQQVANMIRLELFAHCPSVFEVP